MVGFNSTDQYDNATVDNWLMTMDGLRGARICAAKVLVGASTITVVNVIGGISAYVSRIDTGLYLVQFENEFKKIPCCIASTYEGTNYNWQAHVYEPTTQGVKVMTIAYAGAAWAESDSVNFQIMAIGR